MMLAKQQSDIPNVKTENQGCPASIRNGIKCGEIKTLDILREFQELYESKLNEIKDECGCTSTRIKIQMLEDWVKDLTEQNTMLVQVVEELEQEASERVFLLEEKLRNSSKTSLEIMKTLQEYDAQNISNQSDIFQRLMHFQSDVNNLTEFIRRLREDGMWSTEGLHFYNVPQEDLENAAVTAKNWSKQKEFEVSLEKLKTELSKSNQRQDDYETEIKRRELVIKEQSEQIEKLNGIVERCASSVPDQQNLIEELQNLRSQLKIKKEDFDRLELSVKDMREALTAEVADKHDSLLAIRRECQLLEDRCRQADKQTHFKDDIIKEMRKELKQYRSKFDLGTKDSEQKEFKTQISDLQEENKKLHKTISNATEELNILHGLIKKYYMFEECENKVLISAKHLKSLNISEEMLTNKSSDSVYLHKHLNVIEKCCSELMAVTRQTSEELELMNMPRSKSTAPMLSDNRLLNFPSSSNIIDESNEQNAGDFGTTIIRLKTDISKMILWKNDSELNKLRKHVSNIENTFLEINSKDQLIKNKDEMINIQNDTLNVAQKELIELRERLTEVEKERDAKLQEIQNLQQALTFNQNTIEQLENALGNSEEKASNIQQTVDLYMETINLLESAKHKAETEVEQQRITIGNLQDALVSTKQQLESFQGRCTSEFKEKCDIIYTLYQELDEMQSQYADCYAENVKLSQTTDCLRDSNLELRVTNLSLQQDIEELNEKIMNDKASIASLEGKLQKTVSSNESLKGDVGFMKGEMSDLTSELKVLQELLKMPNSLSQVDQLKLTQKQVIRKIKLHDVNTNKIAELEELLELKTKELKDTKCKLEISGQQCEEYNIKIKELEKRVLEHQKHQNIAELKTDEMVFTCNSDLICLKQKVEVLNKILNEKSNEILRLHAELTIKSETITNLLRENEFSLKENKKLTQNVLNLEQQLNTYKTRCVELNEQYLKFKMEIESVEQRDLMLEEEHAKERKILTERLEISKREETRLTAELKKSKQELERIKINLKEKDEELKSVTSSQEEVVSLNEEINKLTKSRNKVIFENQKLQDQITKLNSNVSQIESRNSIISQQLSKCTDEVSILQSSKDKLEEKNIELQTEIEHLQRAFTELNQEIRLKNETFISLEQELSETKCSRDEICAESRMVVVNVRSWLEEQKKINASLNKTLEEKNLVIDQLSVEKDLLLKNVKDVCERYESLTEELQICRQYLVPPGEDGTHEHDKEVITSATPGRRSVYKWEPQSSVDESSSPVYIAEEQMFDTRPEYLYEDNDSEPNPAKWMRKVQEMSEDLLKSKKYWQTKMSNTKKVKQSKSGKSVKST